MIEEWRDIKGFEGVYQVSNMGRVRSLDHITGGKHWRGKILSTAVTAGYPIVKLSKGSEKHPRRVHRLVAEAFLDNPENLPEVNHIDGNKNNNRMDNLEWCTSKENKIHAWVTGLTKLPPAQTPRPVIQILDEKEIASYMSMEIAEIITGIDAGTICNCCKGKRKSAGGYGWKYKED